MTDETTGHGDVSNNQAPLGVPSSPAPTGAPTTGASVPQVPEPEHSLNADIANILKEVKLPERRETKTPSKPPQNTAVRDIDAILSDAPSTQAPSAPAIAETQPQAAAGGAPERDTVRAVHTFKHDVEDVVHDQKITMVRAAALEQEKVRPPVFATTAHSNRIKNTVFAALVLLFLGASALGGVYFVVQDRAAALPPPITTSLIFAEQTVSLSIAEETPAQLKGILSEARGASTASLGSITRIAPVYTTTTAEGSSQRFATVAEFFASIGAHAPEELVRALSNEFFFGLHTVDTNAPVLVIPVSSYDRAFAGMLAWENTINADLAPIYTRVPDLMPGADGIPQKRVFSDLVMRNYDVRALKDDSGNVVMYYTFPTRNLLIIAESPYTFTELLSRLQAQRRL